MQPPGFNPPPFGYGPPPGAPMPPPNPMNPMGPMGPMGPPGYPPLPPKPHGLAIASMICGILAIVPGCCCGFFGIPLSLAALVMGIISISQINASMATQTPIGGKNMALAGTICGGIAIALDIAGVMLNVGSEVLKSAHV